MVAAIPALGVVMQSVGDAHWEHPWLVLSWLHTLHFPLLVPGAIGYEPTGVHVWLPATKQ